MRQDGKRAGWRTGEVNSFVPQASAVASNNKTQEAKVAKGVGESNQAASRYLAVEIRKVVRREKGERGKAPEKEEVVELREEENDRGVTVEKNELYEEGCYEILAVDELKSSEEGDLWSNDDWKT